MSPLSRGVVGLAERWSLFTLLLLLHLLGTTPPTAGMSIHVPESPKPGSLSSNSPEEIEAFVKRLEYEAANGVDESSSLNGLVKIDFNLLTDDVIADDIQAGLDEEFQVVDMKLGDKPTPSGNGKAGPTSRQLSLIYRGVYAPDQRFNAFADGVMVNMVAEMKRKRMNPLFFRVYDRGIIEHVAARAGRDGRRDEPTAVSSVFANSSDIFRDGRQTGNPIGGGVIRGLTNVKRFGNAEVQIAGNTTLVRSHYVFGPLNIELVFHTDKGVKTINSTLGALAAHAVAGLSDNSSKLIDFIIDSPAEYEVRLVGARSQKYQRLSQSAIMRLFKPAGKLERRLKQQFVRSRSRRIPDVTARRNSRRRNRNRQNSQGSNSQNGQNVSKNTTSITPVPLLIIDS